MLWSLPVVSLLVAVVTFGLLRHGEMPHETIRTGAADIKIAVPESHSQPTPQVIARPDEESASGPVTAPKASPEAVPSIAQTENKVANNEAAPPLLASHTLAEGPAAMTASVSATTEGPTATQDSRPSIQTAAAASSEVVVQAGDTLSAIAQRYSESSGRLDVKQLIAVNPEIKNANLIYPGEKVRLSARQDGAKEDHE
jgi:LysM repeat protein